MPACALNNLQNRHFHEMFTFFVSVDQKNEDHLMDCFEQKMSIFEKEDVFTLNSNHSNLLCVQHVRTAKEPRN